MGIASNSSLRYIDKELTYASIRIHECIRYNWRTSLPYSPRQPRLTSHRSNRTCGPRSGGRLKM